MNRTFWHITALAALAALLFTSQPPAEPIRWDTWAVYFVMFIFITAVSLEIKLGLTLAPMLTVAMILAFGETRAGWIVFLAPLVVSLIRPWIDPTLGQERQPLWQLFRHGEQTASILTASALLSGKIYVLAGGSIPLETVTQADIPRIILLCAVNLAVGTSLVVIKFWLDSKREFRQKLKLLPQITIVCGAPMVFSPLVAMMPARNGFTYFILMVLGISILNLFSHNRSVIQNRLEQRVYELNSLQIVSQAISSSLDLEVILQAIYDQVCHLIQLDGFFISLMDPENGEITFPLAYQEKQQGVWKSRPFGDGFSEYVIRSRSPLLIPRDYEARLKELGITVSGTPPTCILGVPIQAGNQVLGVLGVTSYRRYDYYTAGDQEILTIIANQAAVAIVNARLHAQTDQSLKQRVQELNSVFRTTSNGLLFIDRVGNILAANNAFSSMMGNSLSQLEGMNLGQRCPGDTEILIEKMGFTLTQFHQEMENLISGQQAEFFARVQVEGRAYECRLARVLGPAEEPAGWLFVFREISKEVELAKLKDDMTHMLVHDLRSPLSTLTSSLNMLMHSLASENPDAADFITLSQRSTSRMLGMVNTLLEINRLEDQTVPINLELVDFQLLVEDLVEQMQPLAQEGQVTLSLTVQAGIPLGYADRHLLSRVLINLIDNALKVTPAGGMVQVTVETEPGAERPSFVIGVLDTGPGIPPELKSHLFEKFVRVQYPERRIGNGLGLKFCQLAVNAHGGTIEVSSSPGQGSKFIVKLPFAV